MSNECTCDKWKANIDKINAPITLQAVKSGTAGYDGDYFEFCPWCGKPLSSELQTQVSVKEFCQLNCTNAKGWNERRRKDCRESSPCEEAERIMSGGKNH